MKFKINQFNLSYERVSNFLKRSAHLDLLKRPLLDDAGQLEEIIIEAIQKAMLVKNDTFLSTDGKQAGIDSIKEKAASRIVNIDKTETLKNGIRELENILVSKANAERQSHRPTDPLLSYMQENEMRSYLVRLRDEAREAHNAFLQKHEAGDIVLTDQERRFTDPVETLFLDACNNYSADKEQLFRCVIDSPYPILILPPEVVENGVLAMRRSISPDTAEMLDAGRLRLQCYSQLLEGVNEILASPEKAGLQTPQSISVHSDQQRADQQQEKEIA